MCGIAGIANFPEERSHVALKRMRETLFHRGPDDQGEDWLDGGRVGFGHQRLSVIDLSPAGRQPMRDGERLALTFNGEIYNYGHLRDELISKGHDFRTRTDSEVILHAFKEWGTDCVNHFDGMFALAIYDRDSR